MSTKKSELGILMTEKYGQKTRRWILYGKEGAHMSYKIN